MHSQRLEITILKRRVFPTDYTEYAGLGFPVNSRIASVFSRQIANVTAGPASALESMGARPCFRCHSLNIDLMYKQ